MHSLNGLIAEYLRDTASKFEADTSEVTEAQAIDILKVVEHEAISKEQACRFLNLSRSRFDDLVREGRIPKGEKVTGWKELKWYKDNLELCKRKHRK